MKNDYILLNEILLIKREENLTTFKRALYVKSNISTYF